MVNMESDESALPESTPITEKQKALDKYASDSLVETVSTLNGYFKVMIPLTTGLIGAYVALLKFIGFDLISQNNIELSQIILPPIFILISLILFIQKY